MSKWLIAILMFPVACFGLISRQVGFAHPSQSPRHFDAPSCGYDVRIAILPARPTTSDTISITASGGWYDSCIPRYQSHQVNNNTIRIDAAVDAWPGRICMAVLTGWTFTIGVESLLTGSYQADLYITDPPFTPTPVLCASKSFRVIDLPLKAYLPIVTKWAENRGG